MYFLKSNIDYNCSLPFIKIKASIILLGMSLFLFSCEQNLEIELPNSQLTGVTVFEDTATANAALAELYVQLRDNTLVTGSSTGLGVMMGLYADELDYYSYPGQPAFNFYNHTVQPTDLAVGFYWNNGYKVIYGANAVIEGLRNSTVLSEEEKAPLMGQAYFIRAYVHFYLLNLFGGIPYIESTDYTVNSEVSRLMEIEVYQKIIADLVTSQSLLEEADSLGEHIYPTKITATAFLAKVYLFNEQWTLAKAAANDVINSGQFSIVQDLDSVFLPESSSTLWQLKPPFGNNTLEAQIFIFESGPPSFVSLRPDFVNDFDAADLRQQHWIGEATDGDNTWYFPNKYKLRLPTESSQEYSVLLRLEEIYLIRAEADAKLNNLSDARSDISIVRQRAGLENTTANTQQEILDAISKERKWEFFAEQGLRWFYLKHSNRASLILEPIKTGWRETDILLPLPQEELLLNPNLEPQNPGY